MKRSSRLHLLVAATLGLAAPFAAAAPTATLQGNSSLSFTEYANGAALGAAAAAAGGGLQWVHESSGSFKGREVDSWLVFVGADQGTVRGNISFDGDVLKVFKKQSQLKSKLGRSFEDGVFDYDYGDRSIGLETGDRARGLGRTLKLRWNTAGSGDYVRVLTLRSDGASTPPGAGAPELPGQADEPPAKPPQAGNPSEPSQPKTPEGPPASEPRSEDLPDLGGSPDDEQEGSGEVFEPPVRGDTTNGPPVAVTPIPEPSTYALMGAGLLAVLFMSRRRVGTD